MLLLEDKRFYTYIYLNPLKSGTFIYNEFCFAFEPFYVGKGQGRRLYDHLSEANRALCTDHNSLCEKYNKHKINTINQIKRELNCDPIIIKLKSNLTNFEACELEKYLIKIIGRDNLGLGPLTNLTDGGDSVLNLSIESKLQKVESFKNTIENNPQIFKQVVANRNKFYIENPTVNEDRIFNMKKTLKNNPNITKNAIFKRDQLYEKHPEILIQKEESRISTCLDKYQVVNVFQTDFVKNKIKELNDNDTTRIQRRSLKARETCLRNRSDNGNKNSRYKELNLFFILNLYFSGKNSFEIANEYTLIISKISYKPIYRVLDILNLHKNCTKNCKKEHSLFIEENKHKQQWYIDNYKRLEQEYFDRKFEERHPEFAKK